MLSYTDHYGNQLQFDKLDGWNECYTLKDHRGKKGTIYLSTDDYIWGNGVYKRFQLQEKQMKMF
jgi:hypothetical protein